MAGEESRFAGELHHFPDGGFEVGLARVGEVRAADGAHDDQVAADEDAGVLEVVHHVAGRVAGRVEHADAEAAEGERLAVLDVGVGLARRDLERDGEPHALGAEQYGTGSEGTQWGPPHFANLRLQPHLNSQAAIREKPGQRQINPPTIAPAAPFSTGVVHRVVGVSRKSSA